MACGARIGPEKQKQRLCNTNNGLGRKLSRPERVDMIMRKMFFCFLSGLLLLTGCAEGKQISLSPESGAETSTAIVTEDQNAGEMVAEKATDTLKEVNDNIVYHLQSWQLYDTLTAAGIAKEDLDEDINEDLIKNYDAARRILVLTIQISCEGENEDANDTMFVNDLDLVTKDAIKSAKVEDNGADEMPTVDIEYRINTVFYLDIGEKNSQDYFKINRPAQGETQTITLGYLLDEDEYTAAEQGELYVMTDWENTQKVSGLQVLYVDPKDRQE